MEPWGVEIKSGERLNVSLEYRILHITQACLGNMKRGSEGIGRLEIVAVGKTIAIEGLCRKARIQPVGQQFDKDFIIVSHGFEDCSVFLYGQLDTIHNYGYGKLYRGVDLMKLGRALTNWEAAIKAGRSAGALAQAYAQWIAASTPPVSNDDDDDDFFPEAMDSDDEKYEKEKCGAIEPWGVEIKSGEPLNVSIEQGKFLNILQACLGNMKKGSEGIGSLEIIADGKTIPIEGLCKKAQIRPVGQEFDKDFIIVSHGFEDCSVFLYGEMLDTLYNHRHHQDDSVDGITLVRALGKWKAAIEAGRSAEELAQAYAQYLVAIEPPDSNDDYFIPEAMDSDEECDSLLRTRMRAAELARLVGKQKKPLYLTTRQRGSELVVGLVEEFFISMKKKTSYPLSDYAL